MNFRRNRRSDLHVAVLAIQLALALVFGLADRMRAQTAQSEITGEVTDPGGAPMAQVVITLLNTATGTKTATLPSNEAGLYYVRSLPPGVYDIEATKTGFKTFLATGVRVSTGQVLRYDIKMQVGDIVTRVEVTGVAGTAEIQKESGDVSSVISELVVKDMPVLTRRIIDLVALTPGVAMTGSGLQPFFSIAGNPGVRSNMYVLDGGNTGYPRTQGDGGTLPLVNPTPEVIKEMRVITNNYSAEFGEGAGGVIMLTTKSGTNEYHGEVYGYIQNEALDARNFFAGANKQKNRLQQYGAMVGGPVIKNRTHFMVNIERQFTGSSGPSIVTLPTLQQRKGDFAGTFNSSGRLIPIYDPAATSTVNGQSIRDPFPGNVIPSARIDPVAANLVNYWPDPNLPGLITGGNNFTGRGNGANRPKTDHVRVDHQVSEKERLYFRYTYNRQPFRSEGSFRGTKGAQADPGSILGGDYWPSIGVSWTRLLTANTFNEFRFNRGNTTFHHYRFGNPDGQRLGWAEKLGLKNLSPDAFPTFDVSGYALLGSGLGGWQEIQQDAMRAITLEDTVSHHRGHHNLRFGGTWKNSRAIFGIRTAPSGTSSYDGRATALPGVAGTGNPFASFLLGQVSSATVRDTPSPDVRTWFVGAFIQDDWKLTKNLTLNLGARYEFDNPKQDVKDIVSFFDPTKINPVCNCPGVIEFDRNFWTEHTKPRQFYNALYGQIAPRIGFAWTPLSHSDLVVRGGYGIFYTGLDYGDLFWNIPLLGAGKNATWTADGQGITPAFVLGQGFPAVPLEPLNDSWGAVPIGQTPRTLVDWYWPQRSSGYNQQYNLGVQKQIGSTLVELGYLGASAKKLPLLGQNINEVRPQDRGPGNGQIRRPYPQFGNVLAHGEAITSTLYYGGLISVKRSFSNGLTFQTNYTMSRFRSAGIFKSYYDRDHAPSSLERRHRFVWSGVYDVPWGPGKKFLNSGLLGNVAGGWTLGAIVTLQSGAPSSLGNIVNTCNCFTSRTQSVNVVGNPVIDHSHFDPGKGTWFNTAAFAAPEPYTYGNAGPGIIRQPGLNIVDTTITKAIRFRERFTTELRGEFYNFFNHTNFGGPDLTFGSPTFGRITSAGAPFRPTQRIIQMAAKFYF